MSSTAQTATEIRPFNVSTPEDELTNLRRRIAATRWPDGETDASQGVQLETIQALAAYWATDYDWRKFEERFAALPHFITEIDGVDIHFIHVRSEHEDALPLIVTHGWPGSTIEQLKIIEPLTDPTAHGADSADAFHLVIPSLPGHGFSGKPRETGWDPIRIAKAWVVLMKGLGYTRYVAQGGDWGNAVTEQLALLKPDGLLGIHTNMPATVPPEVSKALATGGPKPDGLSGDEEKAYEILKHFFATGVGYANEMANRPQTLYGNRGLTGRPGGLDARSRRAQLPAHRPRFRRRSRRPLTRRRPRQHHPLLADEHGGLLGPPLLGEPSSLLRRQRRGDPCRRDRLPGRAVSGSSKLGREGVSEARSLQPGRRGRAFRRLGATADPLAGAARHLQVTTLISALWRSARNVGPLVAVVDSDAAGTDVTRSMAQRAGATITEVDGSHVIMVSQPKIHVRLERLSP